MGWAARAGLALAASAMLAGTGWAQDSGSQVGELVVTAERSNGSVGGTPHVMVFRRADNLVADVQVDCDTRSRPDRLAEIKATLRNMIEAAAASSGRIELGVEADDLILPLQPAALDDILKPGRLPDTSTTIIVVKTHILPADNFETATARITGFIAGTKVAGRTLVTRTGDWELTLVTPRQYRPQIVAAIAEDAGETAKAFGPGYGVEIQGLDGQVSWSRSGPLDLALYIPYRLKIEPAPAR